MASTRNSKSAKIRQAFQELGPDAKPATIRDHLAARRVRASLTLISKIKSKSNGTNRKAKHTMESAKESIAIGTLIAVKGLVDRHGHDAVRQSLEVLQKLAS